MLKKIINHPIWGERLADQAAKYIRFARRHNQFILEPENMDEYYRAHDPFILSVWHGQFLLIPTIRPDDISGTIVVGRHGDAELAAKVVKRFGVRAIRGSGAAGRRFGRDRGGAQVLREALKALKTGDCIVSTADVPPGPAQKVGEGIITMARLSGRPIIPAAIATKRAITFKSWSRLTINLPFSKGALVAGEPIHVPRELDEQGLEQCRRQLEAAMGQVTRRAHDIVGRSFRKIAPLWDYPLKPGLGLKSYQSLTGLARPLAPYIFKYRLSKGKEIEEREQERYGQASIARPEGLVWWFHAASVGETNAILPLMETLLSRHPNLSIVLTTGTVTSAKLAENRLPDRAVHQFVPLDNKSFITKFLQHWRPDLAAFVESEIWPNLILNACEQNIPLVLINGRMSKRSFKRWFKKPRLARPLFGRFSNVLAQSQVDANRFVALGAETVINSGNLKIDAPALKYNKEDFQRLKEALANRPVLVAASTHKGEEQIIAKAHKLIALDYPDFLTIIVPRHADRRDQIMSELEGENLSLELRTAARLPNRQTNIYIADTMGEIGLFYAVTKMAFIGGSFIPHGGQNPIEAIKLDTTILSGPHIANFSTSYHELFSRRGALKVTSAEELAAKIIDLLKNPSQHEDMKRGAQDSLDYLTGAMDITLQTLETYLETTEEDPR